MPREAKIVYVRRNDPVYPLVFLNECFGWELQQLNAQEIVLSRETHNPNYLRAVKNKLFKIMNDKNAPINNLLDKKSCRIYSYFNTPWSACRKN